MIEVRGLTYSYWGKQVLDNVDLTVEQGEICALVGRNGAGKSTLIRAMLGLTPIRQGTVAFAGISNRQREWKRLVSFLPEKFQLYPLLTGEENMRFFAANGKKSADADKIEQCLRQTELWDDREKLARNYSKGMLQRLGLAVMLYDNADIWILDEPTSGLDPQGRKDILAIVNGLSGKTVLFSTHDFTEIAQICTHVAHLADGKMSKSTVAEFFAASKER